MSTTSDFISKNFSLECLAPVHIGSGVKLRKSEYLYDQKNKKVHFINESQWINFLAKNNLMDKFSQDISRVSDLVLWLNNQGIPERQLHDFISSSAKVPVLQAKEVLNDLARCVCGVDGIPYIPGSSIKGFIRTALLIYLLSVPAKKELYQQKYWQSLKTILEKTDNRQLNEFILNLESDFFNLLEYNKQRKTDAVNSIMKGIQVSDAVISNFNETIIVRKTDWSTKADKQGNLEKNISVYRECLPVGAKLNFSIKLDLAITGKRGLKSLESLLLIIQQVSIKIIQQHNENGFRGLPKLENIRQSQANIILGGGTGFISKTLVYALAPSNDEARKVVAKYLDKKFPAHKHLLYDNIISPRTIKLAKINSSYYRMGLGRITMEEE